MKPTVDTISSMKKTDLLHMRIDSDLKKALDIVAYVTTGSDRETTKYVTTLLREDPKVRSVWVMLLDGKSDKEAQAAFKAAYFQHHTPSNGTDPQA